MAQRAKKLVVTALEGFDNAEKCLPIIRSVIVAAVNFLITASKAITFQIQAHQRCHFDAAHQLYAKLHIKIVINLLKESILKCEFKQLQ